MDNFDEIVNVSTFMNRLIYYLKLGIFINKGSTNDKVLSKCISLCNKIIAVQKILNDSESQNIAESKDYFRKLLKRFNLILKVDSLTMPVDVKNKNNQLNIFDLLEHPSLIENNINSITAYAEANNINIFTSIPLSFFLPTEPSTRQVKYLNLVWQYTRSLFYISNILLVKSHNNDKIKTDILNKSLNNLTEILQNIHEIENETSINDLIEADNFLSSKIIKTGLDKNSIRDAHQSIMESFSQNGVHVNKSMAKMIESVTSKLQTTSLQEGNVMQNIFNLAKNVADEIKDDVSQNPDEFTQNISSIFNVFQSNINNNDVAKEIGPEFSGIMSMISSFSNSSNANLNSNSLSDNTQLNKSLIEYIESNNLDKNDFLNNITGDNGTIDLKKLETILSNQM